MAEELSRRSFIKLAVAVGAAAVPGCEPAGRKLIPYVIPDDNVIPGVATYYATSCTECPAGCGLVAKVREGRVIKLDGNPRDPISAGGICARGQAGLQGLYNPDRLAHPQRRSSDGTTQEMSWDAAIGLFNDRLRAASQAGPGRVALIASPQGPALTKVAASWLDTWRSDRLLCYEALNREPERLAVARCFGRKDLPVYRIDEAEVVVSFGADFLETWNSPVEMTRQYAAFRAPRNRRGALTIGRSIYVGPRFGLTAAKSDEWVASPPGAEALIVLGVLNVIVRPGRLGPDSSVDKVQLANYVAGFDPDTVSARTGVPSATILKIGEWLGQADGALVLAGTDDLAAHVACFVINAVTGNLGRTIQFLAGASAPAAALTSEVEALAETMRQGAVDVLLVAGGNPLFSIPASAGFVDAMQRVPFVVWSGTVPDETAGMAHLLLPIDHPLETWSDATPRGGIHAFAQPVTARIFDSRALGDVLIASARAGGHVPPEQNTVDAVEAEFRALYAARGGGAGFENSWFTTKQQGGVLEDAKVEDVRLDPAVLRTPISQSTGLSPHGLSLVAYPHIFFYDGRGADKPWLQEIPEPISQFTWDCWAEIHPDTAKGFGIARNDVIELSTVDGAVELPAYVSVRVHPDAIAVPIGQGHTAYGRYANGRGAQGKGANVWRLLGAGRAVAAVKVRATGRRHELISAVTNGDMMGRPIVEAIALGDLARGLEPPHEPGPPSPWEMYEQYQYPKHKWGMTIDVNACTGCSACVAACYAENNVPVVGKEMVDYGRVMAWIRIDRFFPTKSDAPPLYLAPMLCQQCDQAPCEPVCPVFAAYHTDEGLNGQVYNRCVGTRYCENNCPYKVRRFNWFKPQWPAPLNLQLNPDVTVRGAGVMEKCTFCVQRIVAAEIDARIEKRPVRDGEIVPACAQACPARAITFGDMNDPNSAMMRRRADNQLRDYRALEELNTRPAIAYLRTIYRPKEKA